MEPVDSEVNEECDDNDDDGDDDSIETLYDDDDIRDGKDNNPVSPREDFEQFDYGVSKDQCIDPYVLNDEIEYTGAINYSTDYIQESEANLLEELKASTCSEAYVSPLDWPQTTQEPISEYADIKLYVNAFPWLFPGGNCDLKEFSHIPALKWAKSLVLLKDGRFAKDDIWCFFTLNNITRTDNNKNASFYVKSGIQNAPITLDELKEKLRNGDTSFIDKISVLNKKNRGTNSYWRYQRFRAQSWINYHVENGNGPPDIFLTLSCAEYFWPDVIRLLEERIWIENGMRTDNNGNHVDQNNDIINLTLDTSRFHRAIVQYSVVIQEYFQNRVDNWLQNIGKKLLGIEHYWGRYEFAHGRGQIHVHLLCILNKEKKQDLYQRRKDYVHTNDEASVLGDWAEDHFGLTAKMNRNM